MEKRKRYSKAEQEMAIGLYDESGQTVGEFSEAERLRGKAGEVDELAKAGRAGGGANREGGGEGPKRRRPWGRGRESAGWALAGEHGRKSREVLKRKPCERRRGSCEGSGMLGIGGATTRVYLAVGATDMRKGMNGLHGLVKVGLSATELAALVDGLELTQTRAKMWWHQKMAG